MIRIVDGIAVEMTEAEIAEFEASRPAPLPAPPRYVPKLLIVDRLIAAGQADAALAALAADPITKLRWDAAVEIAADDPSARALLAGIGADPDVILAP